MMDMVSEILTEEKEDEESEEESEEEEKEKLDEELTVEGTLEQKHGWITTDVEDTEIRSRTSSKQKSECDSMKEESTKNLKNR